MTRYLLFDLSAGAPRESIASPANVSVD